MSFECPICMEPYDVSNPLKTPYVQCSREHMVCRNCIQLQLGSLNYGTSWTSEVRRREGNQVLEISCGSTLRYSCPECRDDCPRQGYSKIPCFRRSRVFEEMMAESSQKTGNTVDIGVRDYKQGILKYEKMLAGMIKVSAELKANLKNFDTSVTEAGLKVGGADQKLHIEVRRKCEELKKLEQEIRKGQIEQNAKKQNLKHKKNIENTRTNTK